MPLHSTIDPKSSEFAGNAEVMRGLVAELRAKLNQVAGGGGKASRARHTSRGKMLARDRVDLLVDPGTAFLELSTLAAHGLYGGDVHSASVITGVGRISGRECVIVANDATIKGGTYYPMTVKKHLRAQDIARQELAAADMLFPGGGVAALRHDLDLALQVGDEALHALGVGLELGRPRVDLTFQHRHQEPSSMERPITSRWMSLAPS